MSSSSSGAPLAKVRPPNVEYVSTIKKGRHVSVIILRLLRIWSSAVPGIPESEVGIEAVAIDEKGDAIPIIIEKIHVEPYRKVLQEGKIYIFKNVPCVPAANKYRPLRADIRLRVNSDAEVTEAGESVAEIQHHYFEFLDYLEVPPRKDSNEFLTDLVGVITKIVDPLDGNTKFGTATLSKLYIQDLNGNELPVVLWGDLNHKFRQLNLLEANDTCVFVVSSLIIKKFGDEFYGQNSSATKFYINMDIPEVQEYLARFQPVQLQPQQVSNRSQAQTIASKSLAELAAGPSDDVQVGKHYYCRAKVIGFNTDRPWYYTGCKVCKRRLKTTTDDSGITKNECESCNKTNAESGPWYRVQTDVEDDTGVGSFTLFGHQAEKLIGAKVTLLVNSPNMDPQIPHPLMLQVVGKIKTFEVTVKQNFKDEIQILVHNVFHDTKQSISTLSPTVTTCTFVGGSSSGSSVTPKDVKKGSLSQCDSRYDHFQNPAMHKLEKDILPNIEPSKQKILRNFVSYLMQPPEQAIANTPDQPHSDVHEKMQGDTSHKGLMEQHAMNSGMLHGTLDTLDILIGDGHNLQFEKTPILVESGDELTDGPIPHGVRRDKSIHNWKNLASNADEDDLPLSCIFSSKKPSTKGKALRQSSNETTEEATTVEISSKQSGTNMLKVPRSRKITTKGSTLGQRSSKRPKKGSC